jgi:hypothetical protein
MAGYLGVRDRVRDSQAGFAHLDAAQLVKHALALRTQASKTGRLAALVYLYAEPDGWPDGRQITRSEVEAHRREIKVFADAVQSNEVRFLSLSYGDLLADWRKSPSERLCRHAEALQRHFAFAGGVPGAALSRTDEIDA